MRKFKATKKSNKTSTKFSVFVFFLIVIGAIILFNYYGKYSTNKILNVIDHKINKVTYQFFSDLITDNVINKKSSSDILSIKYNSSNEIISVDYDLEKTYKLLTDISKVLKDGLSDFENGKIDVTIYDSYLKTSNQGLYLSVPFFIATKNIFLTNFGPKIPIHIHFTGSLLTNIKTKVTEYGFNNALLEIYVTVNITESILTPHKNAELTTDYDILIAAKVINGKVPEFYGTTYEKNSNLIDTPLEK